LPPPYEYVDAYWDKEEKGWYSDTLRGGSRDGAFDYYWNGSHHIFEFAKPLKSKDGTRDFNLTFGERITFAIKFADGSSGSEARLPKGFNEENPNDPDHPWDPVIIVASPPAPRRHAAPVGGVKVPINTRAVLMHTPLPTLALALVLACLAIVAIKRAKS